MSVHETARPIRLTERDRWLSECSCGWEQLARTEIEARLAWKNHKSAMDERVGLTLSNDRLRNEDRDPDVASIEEAFLSPSSRSAEQAAARRDWRLDAYQGAAPVNIAAHRFDNDLRYGDGNHPRQWHLTPPYVLDLVRRDLGGGIGLDPCTFADNPAGADYFYTVDDDGLARPWRGQGERFVPWFPSVFVNPPYGKAREPWVQKCIEAGAAGQCVILLIPAATDTRIFQAAVETSTAVVFMRGRLKFGTRRENRRQHAASHPSALIGWNTDLEVCSSLGLRVALNASNPASDTAEPLSEDMLYGEGPSDFGDPVR